MVVITIAASGICRGAEPETETGSRWDHKAGAELALRSGDKTIWAYHFKADGGYPYVHPLATADVTSLTAL